MGLRFCFPVTRIKAEYRYFQRLRRECDPPVHRRAKKLAVLWYAEGGRRQCHCLHSGRDCQGERTGTVSLSETAFDRTALFGQDSEPGGSDAVSPVVQDHAGCLHGAENKHQCTEGSLTRSLGCLLSRAVIKRLHINHRGYGTFSFLFIPVIFHPNGWKSEIKGGIRFSAKKRRCPHAAYAGHVLDVGLCMTLVLLFCETSGERIRSHMHRAWRSGTNVF